jgi:hypothetical protein
MNGTPAAGAQHLRFPTRRQGLSAFLLAFIPPLLYYSLGAGWALLAGTGATAWAAWALVQGIVYPHAYRGKRWSLLGLAVAGATTYVALGDVAQNILWRRSFQLSPDLAVYQDPVDKWSVLYPHEWTRQEQRVSGTTNHVFHPSKLTPAMQFSVTRRPNVGTDDLALIVEGFFMNLPKGSQTEILEKEPASLPTGEEGYRVVYTELSRRIPLKNELFFILHGKDLYFLSIQAGPRWFDRHRVYLEKLLFSLTFPPAE